MTDPRLRPEEMVAVHDLPEGVVVAGADGCVTALNDRAARILGMSEADTIGKHLKDALPLSDELARDWYSCADPYGGLSIRTGHRDRPYLLPDGRVVLVAARFVRSGGRTAPVDRVVVTLRSAAALTTQERQRADLVATVAHELRSPLTSVKGFTATLLAKWHRFTDDQKRLMLETVNADADRLGRLITDLLDVARIEAGRLEIRRAPVDIPSLVHRHVESYVVAGQDPKRFQFDVHGPIPEVWADADKLDQVVSNLLDNALRHGAGTVAITIEPVDDAVAVAIADEGEGIREEHLGRVFTKFWRDSHRSGSGLGLYLARGMVVAHGGEIMAGRGPNGGAVFRFTVPSTQPDH